MPSPAFMPVTFRKKLGAGFHFEEAFGDECSRNRSQPARRYRCCDMGIAQQRMRLEVLLWRAEYFQPRAPYILLPACFNVPPNRASRRNIARQEHRQQSPVLVLAQH